MLRALVAVAAAALSAQTLVGPTAGALVVIGGGTVPASIMNRFIELAGGPASPVVFIPTAGDRDQYNDAEDARLLRKAGLTSVTILHTRDRARADSEEFVMPLRNARGVWIGGGRHWRLADSYLDTRTHRELWKLLERGGVIAGTSAGATVQGSYMVRGAREGNRIMMAPGYERGFGFLRDVAIDQHLIMRKRQDDLLPVIDAHPELLGIGIDEATAIVVQGDRFEVVGDSKAAVYEGKGYHFLEPGDRYDLRRRVKMTNPN